MNVTHGLHACLIIFLLTLEASDHFQLFIYLSGLFGFWRRRVHQRRHPAELGGSDSRRGKFILIYLVPQGQPDFSLTAGQIEHLGLVRP